MTLDMGKPTGLEYWIELVTNRVVVDDPKDIEIIDGEFQGEDVWKKYADKVDEWLKVEPLDVPECIIGFRGGEYQYFPELFLQGDYWNYAIRNMQKINPYMHFRVVTDDPKLAKLFFPQFPVSHEMGHDWRSVRYAKYAIIANSSFFIFPRILSGGYTIAPLHWARHHTGVWSTPDNCYKSFTYQDREGKLHDGTCAHSL